MNTHTMFCTSLVVVVLVVVVVVVVVIVVVVVSVDVVVGFVGLGLFIAFYIANLQGII